MRNILFTSETPFQPYRGGVGRVTDILCKEFLKRGYNLFYLHKTWYDEERKHYNYPVPVTILPTDNINDPQNITFYQSFLKEKGIDIVIDQDSLFGVAHIFSETGNKQIKVISVIHSNPLLNYNHLWRTINIKKGNSTIELFKRIARCLLFFRIKSQMKKHLVRQYKYLTAHSDAIVLLSERYKPALQKIHPQIALRAVAIANPNSFEDIKSIPQKENEIIYVGRLAREKKASQLLLLWKDLYKKHPDWKLSIIGDGKEKENLIALSKKLKLHRVTFYGFQDTRKFYERASILCMTSIYEGFPVTLTEAMQFGCVPIAFSSFEAVYDIIIPNETGELVTPFSLWEYRKKLERLMTDETYRKRLSQNAFSYVERFNIKSITEQWVELFNKL